MTGTRTAGRPSAKVLTTGRITTAAKNLLKRYGEFTMASLAKELKVAPSSLYNHVSSRAEVMAKISDSVVKDIDTSALIQAAETLKEEQLDTIAASLLWIEATSHWAHSYRSTFAQTPELVPHLAVTPVRQAPQTLAMYERVVSVFITFGFSPALALSAVEAIEAFMLGSALDATAPQDIFDPAEHSDSYPLMQRAYQDLTATSTKPDETAFNLGLQALLLRFSANVCGANS